MEEGKGSVLARRWKKMREEVWTGRGESEWKKERRVFFEDTDVNRRSGKRWKGGRGMVWGTGESLPYPYREIQRKERWEKIEDSRYSRYGKVKGKGE